MSLLTVLIAQVMSSRSMIQTLTSGMSPKLTIEFLTSMVPVFTEDLVLIEPAQFLVKMIAVLIHSNLLLSQMQAALVATLTVFLDSGVVT